MQQELFLKVLPHSMVGVALITILLVLVIGLIREINGGEPNRGMVQLGIVVMSFCTLLALIVALYSASKMVVREKLSQRLDTANWRLGGVDNEL